MFSISPAFSPRFIIGFISTFLILPGTLTAQITKEKYKKAEYFLSENIQKEVYHLEVIPKFY
jgi:hypothetical protein